eukprot:g9453.t1
MACTPAASSTCTKARPSKWVDGNACNALCQLILDDRRIGSTCDAGAGLRRRKPLPPFLYREAIGPFLRFESLLPNMLYAFGGRNQEEGPLDTARTAWYTEQGIAQGLLSSCDLYDPQTGSWIEDGAAPLTRARWGHGCASLQGKVYVVGGCSLQLEAQAAEAFMVTLRHCEIYDPDQNRWTPTGPLQIARSGTRVVALDSSHLAAIGGCDDVFGRAETQPTVELYDAQTEVEETGSSPSTASELRLVEETPTGSSLSDWRDMSPMKVRLPDSYSGTKERPGMEIPWEIPRMELRTPFLFVSEPISSVYPVRIDRVEKTRPSQDATREPLPSLAAWAQAEESGEGDGLASRARAGRFTCLSTTPELTRPAPPAYPPPTWPCQFEAPPLPMPPLPPQSADRDYEPTLPPARLPGTGKNGHFMCKFVFNGFDANNHADFELVPRLIGCNLRPISQSCRGKIRVTGWDGSHTGKIQTGRSAESPVEVTLSNPPAEHPPGGSQPALLSLLLQTWDFPGAQLVPLAAELMPKVEEVEELGHPPCLLTHIGRFAPYSNKLKADETGSSPSTASELHPVEDTPTGSSLSDWRDMSPMKVPLPEDYCGTQEPLSSAYPIRIDRVEKTRPSTDATREPLPSLAAWAQAEARAGRFTCLSTTPEPTRPSPPGLPPTACPCQSTPIPAPPAYPPPAWPCQFEAPSLPIPPLPPQSADGDYEQTPRHGRPTSAFTGDRTGKSLPFACKFVFNGFDPTNHADFELVPRLIGNHFSRYCFKRGINPVPDLYHLQL